MLLTVELVCSIFVLNIYLGFCECFFLILVSEFLYSPRACEIILCQLVVKRTCLAVKVGVVLINTLSNYFVMIFNEALFASILPSL